MSRRLAVLAMVLGLAPGSAGSAGARQAASDAPDTPLFGVSSQLVQVDVVVRDRRGRAVRDLVAADFTVYEGGERQTIQSFHVVSLDGLPRGREQAAAEGAARESSPRGGAAAASAPAAEPTLIVFVFDRMSIEARHLAHDAASRYLQSGHVDGDLVAVFSIGLALHLIQDFTTDREAIALAFDRALRGGGGELASSGAGADVGASGSSAPPGGPTPETGASGVGDPAQAAAAGLDAAFGAIEQRMAWGFERLQRDQQGYATTNGLLAIADGLQAVPGRKTLVFFAQPLALTSDVMARFRSVISAANRAQVSVYSIDASGLTTASYGGAAAGAVRGYARDRLRQEESGRFAGVEGPMTQRLEQVEYAMRYNPQAGLGQLAEETGGFLVAGTNDPGEGFEHIQEDMRFHYVLAYSPTDPDYDGRFREIRVEVDREDVRVQSRRGYYAVRPDVSVPVRGFEAPAIAALDSETPPRDFPITSAASSFPEPGRPGRVTLLAHHPVGAMAFRAPTGGDRTDYEADFAVVARVRDAQGREVDRIGQQYRLSVPPASLEAAKAGDVLFFREVDLPPGSFTVDVVAHDAIGAAASVAASAVTVPDPAAGGPLVSSLVLVRRGERLPPEEREGDNPLIYGELLLYPNLGGAPFGKATPLTFFFTVHTRGEAVEASLDLLEGGRVAATLPISLGPPDPDGRIQYAGTLPLESLPPGTYGLRLEVTGATGTATREAELRVSP